MKTDDSIEACEIKCIDLNSFRRLAMKAFLRAFYQQ